MARIMTKYGIGQTVWFIRNLKERQAVPCSSCHGKGSVTVDGVRFQCPQYECIDGFSTKWLPTRWLVHGQGTIGFVRGEVQCCEPQKISYMLNETGIGSGSVYDEDNLFPNRAAAEATCERRNAETTKE